MSDPDAGDDSELRSLLRSIAVPTGLAGVAVVAGTVGYVAHLRALPAYGDAPATLLLSEGFFRSLGFLVLSMGATSPPAPLPFALLTLGRVAGLLFFSYAAVAGVGVVFADRLRPLRIEAWSLLGRLPGVDDRGHVIVCGVGENGHALAVDALDRGRRVVAVDARPSDRTADLEARGALVVIGDATNDRVLAYSARLRRATDAFVTAGSDATNGAVVEAIRRQVGDRSPSRVLDITARIEGRRLRRTLHEETTATAGLHLRTYDVPSATARDLLAAHPIDDVGDPGQRVHVWLVGWTPLTAELLDRLFRLMHYPEEVDRQVTVVTDSPTGAERDVASLSPGTDPEWWDDEPMSEFVRTLFPAVDVRELPASDIQLLSDRNPLYDTLQPGDRLTIVADDTDERSLRALLSTWTPKLDELTRRLEMTATLVYRSAADADWRPSLSHVDVDSYTDFVSGCSIRSVRGAERDRAARRFALVYHLLYEDDPAAVLPGRESVPVGQEDGIDVVVGWLESLPRAEREGYATAVWRDLPEYQRDSNRYAADHAATKRRMAAAFGAEDSSSDGAVVRMLAESEHRRWCAEKILDGWEPLPEAERERWETDEGEQALRDQRYHLDIRPVETLRAEMDGEWDKDRSQVETMLAHPEFVGGAAVAPNEPTNE